MPIMDSNLNKHASTLISIKPSQQLPLSAYTLALIKWTNICINIFNWDALTSPTTSFEGIYLNLITNSQYYLSLRVEAINLCNIFKRFQLTHLGPASHTINQADKRFRVSQFKAWLVLGNDASPTFLEDKRIASSGIFSGRILFSFYFWGQAQL